MKRSVCALLLLGCLSPCAADDGPAARQENREILVTFENKGASASAGIGAPYRFRKRYTLSAEARQAASAVSKEYGLKEIDDWPIKSLSVYCFVYKLPDGDDRDDVLQRLRADARVESAQEMNRFETGTTRDSEYDDTYSGMQRSLQLLDVTAAHRHTRGDGVRVAVIDSDADTDHEDLRGRFTAVRIFADKGRTMDQSHGTAIASVIGASANNAKGIVGVAPEADMELLVSCWADATGSNAICDTFSLAKALDALVQDPPQVLNMSLVGPYDPLLHRLISRVREMGVVVIAASRMDSSSAEQFPASVTEVISVGSSDTAQYVQHRNTEQILAPGSQIMVATPDGGYDFRSGTSISAAHVS